MSVVTDATGGDEVFRELVLARIIEPGRRDGPADHVVVPAVLYQVTGYATRLVTSYA